MTTPTYQDYIGGRLDAALATTATSMSSPALAAMEAVASPEIKKITVNPDGRNGLAPEVVYMTAHAAAGTTGTILRAQDGTSDPGVSYPSGTTWVHTILSSDIGGLAVNTVAATGATETIQWGVVNDLTMDQNCTFSFETVPATVSDNGLAPNRTLVILRGAFTPTWPAAVDWPDSTEPTYSTPTIYEFLTVDDGTTVLGWSNGKAFG